MDLSPALLQELVEQARLRGLHVGTTTEPAQNRTVATDLVEYLAGTADGDRFELVVCMGDTLTHLATFDQVNTVFETAHQKLEAGGRLVLGFRDLSEERLGLDRFLPVRSDAGRVFTCFLEYGISPDHVLVHDLLYVNEAAPGADWKFYRGCYQKLRIGRQWATERLIRAGFRIAHENIAQGFINLIALK